MQIEAVRDHVIFQFTDETLSTKFINSTESGVLLSDFNNTQSQVPRWGKVTHVGPEVADVKVNDFILIDKGKWTQGFYVEGVRYWKTDELQVIGTADEPSTVF